jgi:hypothetical protein
MRYKGLQKYFRPALPSEQRINRELLFAEQGFFPPRTGIGYSLNREDNSRNRMFFSIGGKAAPWLAPRGEVFSQ